MPSIEHVGPEEADRAMKRILVNYPQSERLNPLYMTALAEALSVLTHEELGWVMDPREGVATRTRYLPTPADCWDVIRDRQARKDRFAPSVPACLVAPRPPEPELQPLAVRQALVHRLLGTEH